MVELQGLKKSYDDLEVFDGLICHKRGMNCSGWGQWRGEQPGTDSGGRNLSGRKGMLSKTVIGYFAQHQAEELNPQMKFLKVESSLHDNPMQPERPWVLYCSVEMMFLRRPGSFRERNRSSYEIVNEAM